MTHNPDPNDLGACMPFDRIMNGVRPGEMLIISPAGARVMQDYNSLLLERDRQIARRAFNFAIFDEAHTIPEEPVIDQETNKAEDNSLATRRKKAKEAKANRKPSSLLSNMLGRL